MFELEDQARDLLARTALDIRTNGWHQKDYYPEYSAQKWGPHTPPPQSCPACVYGAMIRASGMTFGKFFSSGEKTGVIERAIGMLAGELGESIAWWNDQPGQTADNVIQTLEDLAGPDALARRDVSA
jgi:hypothetical protein